MKKQKINGVYYIQWRRQNFEVGGQGIGGATTV